MTETAGRRLRALVADDDGVMVDFVSFVLTRAGYAVTACGDGMAALEHFRAVPFDAVVIDVRMPRLSGISFLNNLHRPPGSICRVVMLSALSDQKTEREAIAAGAAAYLVKPANARQILAAVTGTPIDAS